MSAGPKGGNAPRVTVEIARSASVGETMFYGPGAGGSPTATSVVSDLVAVSKNLLLDVMGKRTAPRASNKRIKSDDLIFAKYFLRLHVADKAGVLAKISEVFATCDVSIESVLQQPDSEMTEAEITIITHQAPKSAMNHLLSLLESLDIVFSIKSVYRVEG